jgi:DNA-binding response OmpR family regulator
MTTRALIVEDDPRIVEEIGDLLFSIGHEYAWASNLQDARKAITAEDFAYVLLDLEFPAKPNSHFGAMENGAILLQEIQRIKGHKRLPVIVMTGHHVYCCNRSKDLFRMGAAEIIAKPFPTEARTLVDVISGVLDEQRQRSRPAGTRDPSRFPGEPGKFAGGELILHPRAVELCRVDIPVGNLMRQILDELNATRPSGAFVAYFGEELADRVGTERGQNGVAEAVRDFRDRCSERLLDEANILCGRFDIIQSGGPGYRYNPWIKVRLASEIDTGRPDPESGADEPANAAGEPANEPVSEPDAEPLNDRQRSILRDLTKGLEVRVTTVATRHRCSAATAKRDLAELRTRNLIRFEGPSKTGSYRLVERRSQADRRAS